MTEELQMEYMRFKHVAAMSQANVREHEAMMINYRLEELRKRYEHYSNEGKSLDEVRKIERERLERLGSISASIK